MIVFIIMLFALILFFAFYSNDEKTSSNQRKIEISIPDPEITPIIDFIKYIEKENVSYLKAIYEQHFKSNYLKPLYRKAFEEKINNGKLVSDEFLNILYPILQKAKTYKYNLDFELTGVHIKDRKKYILSECELYDFVILNHEPNNPHDNQAIKVEHFHKKIGYVPSGLTDTLHNIIKEDFLAYIDALYEVDGFLTVDIIICYNHELPL